MALGSTSFRYRFDTSTSDRYLIDMDPRVFAIWVSMYYILAADPVGTAMDRKSCGEQVLLELIIVWVNRLSKHTKINIHQSTSNACIIE